MIFNWEKNANYKLQVYLYPFIVFLMIYGNHTLPKIINTAVWLKYKVDILQTQNNETK
jgi:hypothetical protein